MQIYTLTLLPWVQFSLSHKNIDPGTAGCCCWVLAGCKNTILSSDTPDNQEKKFLQMSLHTVLAMPQPQLWLFTNRVSHKHPHISLQKL